MEPYRHERPNGNMMAISPADTAKAVISVREGDQEAAIVVGAGAVPALAEGLYEAAGLGRPVILAAPAPRVMLAGGPHGEELVRVRPSPAGGSSNLPGVMLGLGSQSVRLIDDEPVRVALALVDAMKEAEGEPDPAEVAELAHEIRLALYPDSDREGLRPSASDMVAARAALRWMSAKAERDA
jgi:hypothetical protein